jgi:hypothetical protein
MINQQKTHSNEQVDKFAEALAAARQMQQEWLNYGLDFVHLYVEDVDGDWLETWGNDEILGNPVLDTIKEFLVSDDDVAVLVRKYVGERSLFDIAVNLAEYWQIPEIDRRVSAVQNLLAGKDDDCDAICEVNDIHLFNLANSLLAILTEII